MRPTRIARSGTAFDRRLVSAGRAEEPPVGAAERALAALGLSTSVAALVPNVGPKPWLGATATAKAVWVGIAATALVGGMAVESLRSRRMPPVVASVAEGATPGPSHDVALEVPAPPVEAPSHPDPPTAQVLVDPVVAPRRRAPALSKPNASVAPDASPSARSERRVLSAEVALVQEASRALAKGEANVALTILDAYRREYPEGVLAEEAGALQVQALMQTGDVAQAKFLARRLLATDPRGVLGPQLRGVIGDETRP